MKKKPNYVAVASVILLFLIMDVGSFSAGKPRKSVEWYHFLPGGGLARLYEARAAESPANSAPEICDNGLKDWLNDTNHEYGVWLAKSSRIVKKDGRFQPQFKDCKDTNAVWVALFVGDKTWDSLNFAQFHLRNAFLVKNEIMIATQNGLRAMVTTMAAALATNAPVATETNALYTVTVGDNMVTFSNCFEVNLHTTDCYVIRWVDGGKTNEFHAWMTNIKCEKQKGRL